MPVHHVCAGSDVDHLQHGVRGGLEPNQLHKPNKNTRSESSQCWGESQGLWVFTGVSSPWGLCSGKGQWPCCSRGGFGWVPPGSGRFPFSWAGAIPRASQLEKASHSQDRAFSQTPSQLSSLPLEQGITHPVPRSASGSELGAPSAPSHLLPFPSSLSPGVFALLRMFSMRQHTGIWWIQLCPKLPPSAQHPPQTQQEQE